MLILTLAFLIINRLNAASPAEESFSSTHEDTNFQFSQEELYDIAIIFDEMYIINHYLITHIVDANHITSQSDFKKKTERRIKYSTTLSKISKSQLTCAYEFHKLSEFIYNAIYYLMDKPEFGILVTFLNTVVPILQSILDTLDEFEMVYEYIVESEKTDTERFSMLVNYACKYLVHDKSKIHRLTELHDCKTQTECDSAVPGPVNGQTSASVSVKHKNEAQPESINKQSTSTHHQSRHRMLPNPFKSHSLFKHRPQSMQNRIQSKHNGQTQSTARAHPISPPIMELLGVCSSLFVSQHLLSSAENTETDANPSFQNPQDVYTPPTPIHNQLTDILLLDTIITSLVNSIRSNFSLHLFQHHGQLEQHLYTLRMISPSLDKLNADNEQYGGRKVLIGSFFMF